MALTPGERYELLRIDIKCVNSGEHEFVNFVLYKLFTRFYTVINLAIQVSVICFASSTSPISSKTCTVPLVALSNALKIHVCVNVAASPMKTVLYSVW